jgi:hypothetical protein
MVRAEAGRYDNWRTLMVRLKPDTTTTGGH